MRRFGLLSAQRRGEIRNDPRPNYAMSVRITLQTGDTRYTELRQIVNVLEEHTLTGRFYEVYNNLDPQRPRDALPFIIIIYGYIIVPRRGNPMVGTRIQAPAIRPQGIESILANANPNALLIDVNMNDNAINEYNAGFEAVRSALGANPPTYMWPVRRNNVPPRR